MTLARLVESIGGPTILIFIGGIIAAIGAVWAAYDQNTSSKKLEQKKEEIARLNRETASAVTGGDSYCYLAPMGNAPEVVSVVHLGEFPLYDVSVRIVDLDDPAWLTPKLLDTSNTVTIGNIPPHSARVLGSLIQLTSDRKRLNLFFSARNGFYTELLRMRLVDGEWKSAIRVDRHIVGGASPIFTKVADGYPKEPDGSVNWE
jgi:hypothetical protein